jgi:hypothetical protein
MLHKVLLFAVVICCSFALLAAWWFLLAYVDDITRCLVCGNDFLKYMTYECCDLSSS